VPFTFKDSAGRQYGLTLHAGKSIEIERDHGINLRNTLDGQLFDKIDADDSLFVALLFELASESATEQGIKPEEFAKALNGDALEAGRKAMLECIVDFSRPGVRPALRTILEKSELVQTLGTKKILTEAENLTPEMIEAAFDRKIQQAKDRDAVLWQNSPLDASDSLVSASPKACDSPSDNSTG